MSAVTEALQARLAEKRAAAATRVPPKDTVTKKASAPAGGTPSTTNAVVWVKYPPQNLAVGAVYTLVPVVGKAQAKIHHSEGYSMVDLPRPLKAEATMKVVSIEEEYDRSALVEVAIS